MELDSKRRELYAAIGEDHDYTIVCIDDVPGILHLHSEIIKSLGWKVFASPDPEALIRFVTQNQHKVVLVLADLKMPGITGLELRSRLLENAPTVPFAILSATIDKELALQGIDLKISSFLEKPFRLQDLVDLFPKIIAPRISVLKDDQEMLEGFVSEASDLVEACERHLLELEKNPSATEEINQLFGCVHTLKGSSSFFHPKTMHRFTHRYEDFLKKLQKRELMPTPDLISAFLAGLDSIRLLIRDLKDHHDRDFDVEKMIDQYFGGIGKSDQTMAAAPVPGQEVVAHEKAEQKTEIKIPLTTLDEFMQLSGEMTVIRSMLNKCVGVIEKHYIDDKDVSNLSELLQELHKINSGVQDKISDLRKVTVKSVFKPLTRAVRDVALSLKKEVELQLEGEDLTIDTSLADVLSKILLHLLKNSVDHGIENPETRKNNHKTNPGKIVVSAKIENDQVVIEIEDDGGGINGQALKKKALQNSLYTPEQLDAMSEEQIFGLIFESGLSTAAAVTDISGRGVGLSMVKTTVEAAGGTLSIHSVWQKGTRFQISLPVPQSVLIVPCLFVKAGKHYLGLQQKEVYRVLQSSLLSQSQLITVHGQRLLQLEEDLIPVIPLAELVGDKTQTGDPESSTPHLVVIHSSLHRGKIALIVDEFFDIEDTVVKKILPVVNPEKIYLGATFLDDGRVGLVLDGVGLMNRMKIEPREKTKPLLKTSNPDPRFLVFHLGADRTYAIPQTTIFRIEKISYDLLHRSGNHSLVPYRGGVLPVLDLNQVMFASDLPEASEIEVVIIQSEKGPIGLRVAGIKDFFTASHDDKETNFDGLSAGTLMIEEEIVTVLDMQRVLTNAGFC